MACLTTAALLFAVSNGKAGPLVGVTGSHHVFKSADGGALTTGAPSRTKLEIAMPHYVALIREESDGCYAVSFPDLPGVITGGDDFEDAVEQATEVLNLVAEDWTNPDGSAGFKPPSTIDELRKNPQFIEQAEHAVVALIEFSASARAAE